MCNLSALNVNTINVEAYNLKTMIQIIYSRGVVRNCVFYSKSVLRYDTLAPGIAAGVAVRSVKPVCMLSFLNTCNFHYGRPMIVFLYISLVVQDLAKTAIFSLVSKKLQGASLNVGNTSVRRT